MTWERRWHPLRQEWVTITSHRNSRPWTSGDAGSTKARLNAATHDPDCYLCPGNKRVSGARNDNYKALYVFDNDHPSYSLTAPQELNPAPGIYRNAPATGITRVGCYSPNHNLSLAELSVSEIAALLDCWADQTEELALLPEVDHVLIFENKGEVIGVSNPHPHCQIYGAGYVFKNIEIELQSQQQYFEETGKPLFADIIASELQTGERVIAEAETALAFLPYFSRFPYEAFVAPRQAVQFLHQLSIEQRQDLAVVLQATLARFDNLWQKPFPYMLVLHQAPCDGAVYSQHHFHIQIHPLMRQANLQKYLAGVESGGGNFLNDVEPEAAASQLRALPTKHYLHS